MALGFFGFSFDFAIIGNVLLAVIFLSVLHVLIELYKFRGMPPGPRFTSIPVFGNFLSFDASSDSVKYRIKSLVERYGPVFSVRLGSYKVVFASSEEAVSELLVTRSSDYSGRPPFYSFLSATFGGKNMAIGPVNTAWRLHRKLLTTCLRNHFSDELYIDEVVSKQVSHIFKLFDDQGDSPFDPTDILTATVANIITESAFGENFNDTHEDYKRFFELNEVLFKDIQLNKDVGLLDFFPLAKYFRPKAYKKADYCALEARKIALRQVEKRKKMFDPEKDEARDLVSVLLKARHEVEKEGDKQKEAMLTDEYFANSLETMFSAGYDPTNTALRWAVAFLASYPQHQAAIQRELDEVVGRDRMPKMSDRPRLPLMQAAIMETLRLGNVLETALPHYTITDTTLCGYRVPKGTVVLPILVSVHLDPKAWKNPEEFNPYRHLDDNGKVLLSPKSYFPFSAGRRACPGAPTGKQELYMVLSKVLHRYTFIPENGNYPIDLTGVKAFARYPKPYKVRAIKRQ